MCSSFRQHRTERVFSLVYPNFRILKKSDTQIWSKFGSFGYFFLFFHPNFWVSKNLVSKFLDTQKFGWKNRKNIQNYQILTKFEYLIFWISKNLDKKLDKNLSKRHGRSFNWHTGGMRLDKSWTTKGIWTYIL